MIYFTKELVGKLEETANDWIDGHPRRGMNKHITIKTQNDVEKLHRVICDKLDELSGATNPGILLEPYWDNHYYDVSRNNSYYISGEYDLMKEAKRVYGIPDDLQKLMHVYALACLVKNNRTYPAKAVIKYLCEQYDRAKHDRYAANLIYGKREDEALALLLTKVDGISKEKLKSMLTMSPLKIMLRCRRILSKHVCESDSLHLRNLKSVFKNYFDVARSCDENCMIPVGTPGHSTCKSLAFFLGYKSWEEMTGKTRYLEGKSEPEFSSLTVLSLAADELNAIKKGGRVRLRFIDDTDRTDGETAENSMADETSGNGVTDETSESRVADVILTSMSAKGDSSDFSVDEVSTGAAGFSKGAEVSFSELNYDGPAEFFSGEDFLSTGNFVLFEIEPLDSLRTDGAEDVPLKRLRGELRERLLKETGEDIANGSLTHAAAFITGDGCEMTRKQLGRFMGMASYYNNGRVAEPSKRLKDAVCTFLGYDSFSDFLLRNFNEEAHDVPRTAKEHGLADFEIGCEYRVTYKPNHVIDFKAVTDGTQKALQVISNAGSRNLKTGDVCNFDKMRRGETLNLHVKGRGQYKSATPIEKILKRNGEKWDNMDSDKS